MLITVLVFIYCANHRFSMKLYAHTHTHTHTHIHTLSSMAAEWSVSNSHSGVYCDNTSLSDNGMSVPSFPCQRIIISWLCVASMPTTAARKNKKEDEGKACNHFYHNTEELLYSRKFLPGKNIAKSSTVVLW